MNDDEELQRCYLVSLLGLPCWSPPLSPLAICCTAFDGDQAATGPEAASNLSLPEIGAATGLKRFPDRLYELLNTEAAPDSLYWLPGGKAFAIDQDNFATEVLDKYFQATKFASFIRRLHKW